MDRTPSNLWQKLMELNDEGYSQYTRNLLSLIFVEESRTKCLEEIENDPRFKRIFSKEIEAGTFAFK